MEGSFRAGDWQVNPQTNDIQRGGQIRHLEPRVMDVLCYLARHAGEVLTKERLIQAVWPDTYVTDDALKYAIVSLRKVLDDDAVNPRFVRTIPRRGYQLIVEVSFDEGEKYSDWEEVAENATESRVPRKACTAGGPENRPYPGLKSFTSAQAPFFFGRELEVEAMWGKLERSRLLGLIGPSGGGKSSFIRAGLSPAAPVGWSVVVATPATRPFAGLALAFLEPFSDDPETQKQLFGFDDPEIALGVITSWRRRHREALIVVDQFEELFTLNPTEVQEQFASLIGRLVEEAGVHVLLSMRDDFLFRCHGHETLEAVFADLTPIGPPTGLALRRALVEPAARCGFRFEDETLVGRMLVEVGEERGALPLFAFAVAQLWERRDHASRLLTRDAYEVIGGVSGALARQAETTLEAIGEERMPLVREIFRNLVTAHGTRAVLDREELLSVFEDSRRQEAAKILNTLIDARLLVSFREARLQEDEDRQLVEVAHESLLTNWPRLVHWQKQDEEGALLRYQLRQAAHLWVEKGKKQDLLWTGTAYQEFSLWRERYPGSLTQVEDEFARSMAERVRRRKRMVRLAVAAAFLIVVAVAAAIGISRQQAVDAARRSEASKLLAIAQLKLQEDPTEALAYTTASLELSDTEASRLFVLKALAEGPPVTELRHGMAMLRAPAFSPDGSQLAVVGHSSDGAVWKEDGSLVARLPGHESSPQGSNVAEWPRNDLLVTGLCCGLSDQVHLWALPEGRELRTVNFGTPSWWGAAFGRLFSATPPGPQDPRVSLLRAWDLSEGEEQALGRFDWTAEGASNCWFTPDGSGFVYVKGNSVILRPLPEGSGPDLQVSRHESDINEFGVFQGTRQFWVREKVGRIRIWTADGSTPKVPVEIPKPETAPETILPEPSGRWVWRPPFGYGNAPNVTSWSLDALPGSQPVTLRRRGSWYGAECGFHPSGRWLTCSTQALSTFTFWPLPESPPSVVEGYNNLTRPVVFSPDSRWLATSWGENRLRLWPLPGSGAREFRQLIGPSGGHWTQLSFDPNGRFIFAVGNEGAAWVVQLDGSPEQRLEGFSKDSLLGGVAVSPSGRLVATGSFYGGQKELRVWDLGTGTVRVFPLPEPVSLGQEEGSPGRSGYEAGVHFLVFDGESLLYTAGHGGIRRWNLETGKHELVREAPFAQMQPMGDGSEVLATFFSIPSGAPSPQMPEWLELRTGRTRPAAELAGFPDHRAFVSAGSVLLAGGEDGLVRVAPLSGGTPHLLVGHEGPVRYVAASPDLKWVASTGEDNTLRLWPMPDLSKPPLHTLPQHQLVAKLKSLTNLRAVPDPEVEGSWKIEVGPFPGWKGVPSW